MHTIYRWLKPPTTTMQLARSYFLRTVVLGIRNPATAPTCNSPQPLNMPSLLSQNLTSALTGISGTESTCSTTQAPASAGRLRARQLSQQQQGTNASSFTPNGVGGSVTVALESPSQVLYIGSFHGLHGCVLLVCSDGQRMHGRSKRRTDPPSRVSGSAVFISANK